jgi:hypothetical protein
MLSVVGLVSLLTRPRLGIPRRAYKLFGNNFIDLVKKDLFYIHPCLENRILNNSLQPAAQNTTFVVSWDRHLDVISFPETIPPEMLCPRNNILKCNSCTLILDM